ncbi:MAG TPA: MarR family transcriptional regulator [Candidatus Gastranaerophilaceae bacterium]|nr:MarR family transcriptional regulator [Candidatus Gastranaerophilaceae bacterium]HPT41931.1 MarR family transcriptional regulator [Candidatus Gastranaerophilaceae bacterium]
MKEKETTNYFNSSIYLMEQVVTYAKIKGTQFFKELKMGVTIDQFVALDAVYSSNDICQRDLSKLILKDRSNTGRILNILELNGFIKRVIETKGKRLVKKIYITQSGKKLVEESIPKLRSAFLQVFENISDKDFMILRETLEKMKLSLSKTTSIQI